MRRWFFPVMVLVWTFPMIGSGSVEWLYTRPVSMDPPEVVGTDRVYNPVDQFILKKLEEKGLTLSVAAERRELIRRLTFDLIGLPPEWKDIESFVHDTSPDAYEKVVDRLLDNSRYGEKWARFWLDLARYADTAGYEGDPDLPHAWRYRDYVIDAFNNDKPYDLFIREQIAGDEFHEIMGAGEIPLPSAEQTVALTFLRLAPFTEPRGDQTRHEMLSEMTSTVGSVFLGLTVGCAQCHDHKYDNIPIKDFYRMKAFFSTVQIMPPERGDGFQIGGPLPAKFYRPDEEKWAGEKRKEIKAVTGKLASLSESLFIRLSATNPDLKKEDVERVIETHPDISPEERREYRQLKIAAKFVKQNLKRLEPVAMSLRHSFGPPYESGVPTTRVMLRGEYDNPGEAVEAGFPSAITGNQDPAPIRLDPFKRWPTRSRRMALANWIASKDNPLTARVMVNRLWQQHFGQGIVITPSDFGKLSGGPSHPELLDWLAIEFIRSKWSIKSMHKLMVMSAAYQQSSRFNNPDAYLTDPNNRLLWKFPRKRLEAEAIRDSILHVSGRLNPEQFGLPIFPPLPEGIEESVKYSNSKWNTQYGKEGRKRSLYIYQQRTLTMPLMQTFDSLVCEESRPRRRTSTTPLQALALMNGEFPNEESHHFANRVNEIAGDDIDNQIITAFQLALSRSPHKGEVSQFRDYIINSPGSGLTSLCRILINSNEFVYVD